MVGRLPRRDRAALHAVSPRVFHCKRTAATRGPLAAQCSEAEGTMRPFPDRSVFCYVSLQPGALELRERCGRNLIGPSFFYLSFFPFWYPALQVLDAGVQRRDEGARGDTPFAPARKLRGQLAARSRCQSYLACAAWSSPGLNIHLYPPFPFRSAAPLPHLSEGFVAATDSIHPWLFLVYWFPSARQASGAGTSIARLTSSRRS